MNSNQNVIIDLKNGNKCEGILVNIDKERMVINLSNAKRITIKEDGSTNEESFPKLEISKEDIKEVKIVQFEAKEELQQKKEVQTNNLNAIPQNLQENAEIAYNKSRSYNKGDDFFDGLTPMSNQDAKNESIRYNDKNCETFDMPKSAMNDNHSNFSGSRRGGQRGRGRGGYNRRGNYNNNYNNRNNYNNYNNNFQQNHHHQGNFGNNSMRGGNFNNNYNRGGRGGYNNNRQFDQRNNNFNNNNNQFGDNESFNNNSNKFFDRESQGGQHRNNYNNNNFHQGGQNRNHYNNNNNSNQFQKQAQFFGGNGNPNFENDSQFSGGNNNFGDQNSFQGFSQRGGNYQRGGFSRGGRGQNRGFNGRGGNNRNMNDNRVPNPEFNALNENNEDQLDDGYVMSIYDKPSISGGNNNMPQQKQVGSGELSAYDPNNFAQEKTKSIYDN